MNVFDIETFIYKKKYIPCLICGYMNNTFFEFRFNTSNLCEEFIDYIFNNMKKKKIIFYVHNINFDGILIIESLSFNNKYKLSGLLIKSNIYYLKIKKENLYIEIRCSYKLMMVSLDNLGKSILNKNKYFFPYNILRTKPTTLYKNIILKPEDFNEKSHYYWFINKYGKNINFYDILSDYCKRDVEILYQSLSLIIKLLKSLYKNIDKLQCYSASSMSIKIFYNFHNIKQIDKKIKKTEDYYIRKAYYGGRCEVFGNVKNDEEIFHYDFPGMYGLCMKEKFPYGQY
jgi:hypothetical protein